MNQQNRIPIGRINDAEIFAVSDHSGETFVPIKPICQALGIAFEPQFSKIKDDISFSSTITIIVTVGADNKEREMVCLPLRRIYGWLYTINPGKVAPQAREAVIKYRDQCNDILYRHFFLRSDKLIEANREEIKTLEEINSCLRSEKEWRARRKQAEDRLSRIRAARLDDAPSLFD